MCPLSATCLLCLVSCVISLLCPFSPGTLPGKRYNEVWIELDLGQLDPLLQGINTDMRQEDAFSLLQGINTDIGQDDFSLQAINPDMRQYDGSPSFHRPSLDEAYDDDDDYFMTHPVDVTPPIRS